MKVIEKGTDRTATAHLYLHGRVPPLDEYGEFVNSDDKAIECFIPVEEGQQIKVGGRFDGTIQTIGYDVCVDGICRKSNASIGRSVAKQSNKRLDADKVLFRNNNGSIVESEMLVGKVPSHISPKEKGDRSLGTVELRIYVLRRAGDEHALQDIDPFYAVKEEGLTPSDLEECESEMSFTKISPQFMMTYEKKVTPLDAKIAKRHRTKIDGTRPGTEAWAVFRFHFRSKDSILKAELEKTFDFEGKGKDKNHRELEIEELPMLETGEKIKKGGKAKATPASSTAPSTPTKSCKDENSTPTSPAFQRSTKSAAPLTPTTPALPAKKDSRKRALPRSHERCSTSERSELSRKEGNEDLGTRLFKASDRKSSLSPGPVTMSDTATTEMAPPAEVNDTTTNGEKPVEITQETKTPKDDDDAAVEVITQVNTTKEIDNITSAPHQANNKTSGHAGDDPVEDGTTTQPDVNYAIGTEATIATGSGTIEKPTPGVKKEVLTPSKRPAVFIAPGSPEFKRTRLFSPPTLMSRSISPALSSKGVLCPANITAARKRVAVLKARRQATAEKQAALDKEISPYQQTLQAALEALNHEAEEEARLHEEEEQRLKESAAWLEELKCSDLEIRVDSY